MRALQTLALAAVLAVVATAAPSGNTVATVDWTGFDGKKNVGRLRASGSGWPACDPGVTQRSGYFDIDATTNKHYFYWMFEAKVNPSTAPVLLWMTGGPGCSSSLAILAENGPCHMNETTGDLYSNPYSWNNVANVIYIDQPAGVGFSYADKAGYDHNETEVANDMYKFMQAFYAAYPQYATNDFFVYGESYGGHYAPATAHRIWKGNKDHEGTNVPLKGLSVGNGMTQPNIQLQWYSHLVYEWCHQVKGAPCVSKSAYEQMLATTPKCVELINICNKNDTKCGDAMNYCLNTQFSAFEATGLNVYDIRIPCKVPGLCYNFTASTNFMNRADVQTSLGVVSQNITWTSCNFQVNGMFNDDWMRNFGQTMVPDLLASDIRVLIYAGDVDFICNWLGNKAWTLALEWPGKNGFNAAADLPWWVDMEPAGRFRTVSNSNQNLLFTFLQVHDAGHMVPMNQPKRALEMVKHFLSDTPFYGYEGPV